MTRTSEMPLPVVDGWTALGLEDHEHLVVLNTDGEREQAGDMIPQWQSEMESINKHLCEANVEINDPAHITDWPDTIANYLLTPYHRQLHRVFTGSYDRGGRLYGGSWQTLPRERRKGIRIDGSAVVNVDFSALHLRLAYAEAGTELLAEDPYDLTGSDHERSDWPRLREGRKRLVSAAFMSKKPLRRWPGATPAEWASIRSCFPKDAKVKDEVAAIRSRHQAIAAWFECNRGMDLQRTESDILVAVLLKLNALGITALPIHDAVLVARSHGETAKRIMEAEARKVTGAKIPVKVSEV
jgi:hypothetical protein